jgi:hypothetical protein
MDDPPGEGGILYLLLLLVHGALVASVQ